MTTTDQQAVTVAQADREAAAKIYELLGFGPCQHIIDGVEDDVGVVQIVARHRLASVSSASAEGASGMKTWLGGDTAPADWNGGRVLFRHGGTSTSRTGEGMCWSHGMLGGGKTDIIAYTPKSEPVPATNQAGEVDWTRTKAFDEAATECLRAAEAVAFADTVSEDERKGYRSACNLMAMKFRVMASRAAPEWLSRPVVATQPATSQEGEGTLANPGTFGKPTFGLDATPAPPAGADEVLRMAVAKLLPIGNDSLPGDRVIPIYVRMDELRALHALSSAQVQA